MGVGPRCDPATMVMVVRRAGRERSGGGQGAPNSSPRPWDVGCRPGRRSSNPGRVTNVYRARNARWNGSTSWP